MTVVAFVCTPDLGSTLPLLPLASALRGLGNDVTVLTGGTAMPLATPALRFVDVLGGRTLPEVFRAALAAGDGPARSVTGSAMRGPEQMVAGMSSLAAEMAGPLLDWIDRRRPEIVVGSAVQPAALLAAAAAGAVAVSHATGLEGAPPAGLGALAGEHLVATADRHGLRDLPDWRLAIGLNPRARSGGMPRIVQRTLVPTGRWSGDRPAVDGHVAVTLGTMMTTTGALDRLSGLFDAMAGSDARFVVTVDPRALSAGLAVPGNVTLCGWAALDQLLDGAAAIVHHGGGGTSAAALAGGLPQLVLLDDDDLFSGADRGMNASEIVACGVGRATTLQSVRTGDIEAVLQDGDLRSAAHRVRRDVQRQAPPAEVARRVLGRRTGADGVLADGRRDPDRH